MLKTVNKIELRVLFDNILFEQNIRKCDKRIFNHFIPYFCLSRFEKLSVKLPSNKFKNAGLGPYEHKVKIFRSLIFKVNFQLFLSLKLIILHIKSMFFCRLKMAVNLKCYHISDLNILKFEFLFLQKSTRFKLSSMIS